MDGWSTVDVVPNLEVRPKTPERIKAEKTMEAFAASKDTCWRSIYDGWEPGGYGDVEREMNKTASLLRTAAKDKGLRVRVNKRKDAIYITKVG